MPLRAKVSVSLSGRSQRCRTPRQEHPHPSELLFVALDVIRLDYKQSSEVDAEEIRLLVSDIQVMCQTPERNESGSGKNWALQGIQGVRNFRIRAETKQKLWLEEASVLDAAAARHVVGKTGDSILRCSEIFAVSEYQGITEHHRCLGPGRRGSAMAGFVSSRHAGRPNPCPEAPSHNGACLEHQFSIHGPKYLTGLSRITWNEEGCVPCCCRTERLRFLGP